MFNTAQLKQYEDDCKLIKRELEYLLNDLHFLDEKDRSIHYAVDFSEIYAYAHPKKTAEEFSLLVDDSIETADLRQRLAFQKLFSEKRILLVPYAIELESLNRRLREDGIKDMFRDTPFVLREVGKIPEKDLNRFQHLAQKTKNQDDKLSTEERKEIFYFIEEYASRLMSFLKPRESSSLTLINELLINKKFINLTDLVEVKFSLDNETFKRWNKKLIANRKKGSNASSSLDAIAVATVEIANQFLAPNAKLFLITRSSKMHKIFEEELEDKLWSESLLRHPRRFNFLDSIEGLPKDKAIQELEDRLNSIEEFLKAIKQEENIIENLEGEFVQKRLDEIKKYWKSKERLRAILSETSTFSTDQLREGDDDTVMQILSLLKNQGELRELISKRVRELADQLESEQDLLAFHFHTSVSSSQETLKSKLRLENYTNKNYTNKYVLRTTLQSTPYSLQFYSRKAQELLNYISQPRSYSWKDVLGCLEEVLSEDFNYELWLAMACILGTIGQWELAEIFCERALEVAKHDPQPAHEVYYFLAICMRKFKPDKERLLNALQYLDEADSLKAQKVGDSYSPDPRYLKEKGIQILSLDLECGAEEDSKIPKSKEGLDCFDLAEKLSHSDQLLKLQILNNRLFYYVIKEQLEDKDTLKKYLQELEFQQKQIEADKWKWSPSILDTVAWTKWKLNEARTAEDKQKIIEILEFVSNCEELGAQERNDVKKRLKEVREEQQPLHT